MTDRDRLIELIKNADNDKNLEWYDLYDLRCGKGCAEYFADYLLANSVTMNEWISVKDRLPNLELDKSKALDWDVYPCLVTIKNQRAIDGRYVGKAFYDGKRFLKVNCEDITHDVTHWMPLPNPPKEVE